ncbi:protein of unknown function [Alteromonas macleodii]|uniref:Uncharacterized protein n=1 Tax=Alteromonas macleodii TaxID=28108 RepID=A0A6T9XXN5_ALTMA|nr:protein of unknown function [Alteromonas macleodii]
MIKAVLCFNLKTQEYLWIYKNIHSASERENFYCQLQKEQRKSIIENYNKHIKSLRWDSNTWALSLRSDFSPRVTAPYVGVI